VHGRKATFSTYFMLLSKILDLNFFRSLFFYSGYLHLKEVSELKFTRAMYRAHFRRVLVSRPFNTAAARAAHVSAQQQQTVPPSTAESLALESLSKKDSAQKAAQTDESAVAEPRNTDRTTQPLSQVFPMSFLMFVCQLSSLCSVLTSFFSCFLQVIPLKPMSEYKEVLQQFNEERTGK